jgi:septal ring factor EnvC (AmiA/AmiB activator)
LQNFSNLRAPSAISPGTIWFVNRKELSAVIAECTARTERAAARTETARAEIEVSRAGIEAARKRQEQAVARHEAAIVKHDQDMEEMRAMRKKTEAMFQDFIRRFDENQEWGKKVFAELADQRDERRALIEALLQAIDRLPPPPPHLRSA